MDLPRPDLPDDFMTLDLEELQIAISRLWFPQRRSVQSAFQKVVEETRRRAEEVLHIAKKWDEFSSDVKYVMFDLEATKRERDALKKRLERLELELERLRRRPSDS